MTYPDRDRTDLPGVLTWPKRNDYTAIHKEQARRMAVAASEPYTDGDCTRFYLFKAVDALGNEMQRTRRISTMIPFLIQVSASALAGSCALNVAPGQFPRAPDPENPKLMVATQEEIDALAQGNEIWRRSCVEDRMEEWSTSAVSVGDFFLEVGWNPNDPKFAEFNALDPRTVRVFYDARDKAITKAIVEFTYRREDGEKDVTYKRTITADRWVVSNKRDETGAQVTDANGKPVVVREYVKGRIVTEDGDFKQDVENTLGICTILHYRWAPRPGSPQLSACASTGYEDVVAKSDSAGTQLSAIGTRHANPKLVSEGAEIADDDVTGTDGTVSAPSAGLAPKLAMGKDESLYYLQVDLAGVAAFRESTNGDMKMARDECPEFIMSESGANASGTALSMRAAAFTGKHGPRQARWRAMFARAASMCRAMELMKPWSDAMDVYVCAGSTPLPLDRSAELDVVAKAVDLGVLKLSDAIAAAQGLGIGPADADPLTYAEDVREERRALDEAAGVMLDRANGVRPLPDAAIEPVDGAPEADAVADPAVVAAGGSVQDVAFNGAQQAAIKEYLLAVSEGALDKPTVIEAIMLGNPNANRAAVAAMVNGQSVNGPASPPEEPASA